MLWYYFMRVIAISDNEGRTFAIDYGNDTDIFYLTDEQHEELLDMIYRNYNDSSYSHIIDGILGNYKIRFSKMKYILEYQPLFVEVGYKYLCTII